MKLITLLFFTVFGHSAYANIATANYLSLFLQNYQRRATVLIMNPHDLETLSVCKEYSNHVFIYAHTQNSATCDFESIITHCKETHAKNIIVLKKQLSHADIQRFAECEHMDVIVYDTRNTESTLSPLPLSLLEGMGDFILIHATTSFFHERGHCIGKVNDTTYLYHIRSTRTSLERRNWIYPDKETNDYRIISTFKQKKFSKKKAWDLTNSITEWIPGINMHTFKMCEGAYPTKTQLCDTLEKLWLIAHNDKHMGNIIVQGSQLCFIDFGNTHKKHALPRRCRETELSYVLEQIA